MLDCVYGKVYPVTVYEHPEARVELQLYSFFNVGTRERYMINATHRPLYPRERDLFLIIQEVGWARDPVWISAEYLAPAEIRSPVRLARIKRLYRLRNAGPQFTVHRVLINTNCMQMNINHVILIHTDAPTCFG